MKIIILLLIAAAISVQAVAANFESEINYSGSAGNYSVKFTQLAYAKDSEPVAVSGTVDFRMNNANATAEDIKRTAVWIYADLGAALQLESMRSSPNEIMGSTARLANNTRERIQGMQNASKQPAVITAVRIDDIYASAAVFCADENNWAMGEKNPLIEKYQPVAKGDEIPKYAAYIFFLGAGMMIGIVIMGRIEKKDYKEKEIDEIAGKH